tara:strand:- start:63 stop:239 length:177 start_codon:yes stop_codon:yes gene_type:complete
MKIYKVTITGVVTTDDDAEHPDSWSWSNEHIYWRFNDMGATEIVITELKEGHVWQQEA